MRGSPDKEEQQPTNAADPEFLGSGAAVAAGPAPVRNWTNPWEGSSDDSPNTSPATLPPSIDLNVDARPAGAGGQKEVLSKNSHESFDNDLMSPLSPLRSVRPSSKSADASPNEDWTNPWEVCLCNTYTDKKFEWFQCVCCFDVFFFC